MGIAILGAGTWGTALAVTIAKNCPLEKIWLWSRNKVTQNLKNLTLPSNIYFTKNLNLTINNNSDLLIAVPSSAFKCLISQIAVISNNNNFYRIAWATKGMDIDTTKFFSEIIVDYFPNNLAIAILAGPSFAQEVLDQKITAVTLAFKIKDYKFANDLFKQLNTKNFRVHFSHDLIGVQLGGVFKNVLAVAVGICDGLNLGANTRSALITMGLEEISNLSLRLNADPKTLLGLSGIGDIILTCCNKQSRNHHLGCLLAKGASIEQAKSQIGQAIEALDNIQVLAKLAADHHVKMPIVNTMFKILLDQISVINAISELFS